MDGGKVFARLIHVRAEHFKPHRLALVDEVGNFFRVAEFGAEHGGHELDRVIRLEVAGLVAEHGVGGGVGFVESVAGEFVEDVENRVGRALVDLVHALGTLHEFRALLRHALGVFLAHGAAEHVGTAERVAGDDLRGLHDLLLINHHAVGLAADFLEEFVRVGDGARLLLAAHVVGNPLHRAGAVERDERHDLVDRGEADLPAEILHAAGFQLEHAGGAAGVEQRVSFRVLEADGLEIELRVDRAADAVDGVGDDGERLQSEEIHLEQAEFAHGVHVILHGHVAFLQRERHELVEPAVGDDDARGVLAGVAHHALEHERLVDDFFRRRIAGDLLPQLRGFLDGGGEVDVQLVRNHLRQAVGVGVGEIVDARDVADDGLCAECAVGDDVGDAVLSVFLADVVDDLAAAAHAEVDVEVRRRHALGVEEAFEEQLEAQRVEIRDPEQVGHDAAGTRAATGADGNAVLFCPRDEIPDDEEVVEEACLRDDAEFEIETLDESLRERGILRGCRRVIVDAVAGLQARDAQVTQVAGAVGLHLDRQRIFRVALAAFRKLDGHVAHLGDGLGVGDGFGHIDEQSIHLRAVLQVELRRVETHAVGVLEFRAGLDAQHRVVRRGVGGVDVVDVVRRDDLQLELLGEFQEQRGDAELLGDTVVLEFDEEVLAAEHLDEAPGRLPRVLPAIVQEHLRNDGGEAAAERDEALGVGRERRDVGARLVVEALEVRVGDELEEVGVALRVFRDQAHVIETLFAFDARGLFEARALDEIDFAADERLHAFGFGGVEKIDRPEQHAVVGQRHGGLAQLRHAADQAVDAAGAVEQAVVAVDMQVDEILVGGCHGF